MKQGHKASVWLLAMQLLLLWLSLAAMFNKRKLDDAYMRDLPLEKRFREDLREVFVNNELIVWRKNIKTCA